MYPLPTRSLVMIYSGFALKGPTHRLLTLIPWSDTFLQTFGLSALCKYDTNGPAWCFSRQPLNFQRTFSEEPPAFKVPFSCPAIKCILFSLQRLIWAPKPLNLKKPHISEQEHSTRPAGGKDGGQRRWLINRNSICSHCFSSSQQNL